jgi:hypothetical protein
MNGWRGVLVLMGLVVLVGGGLQGGVAQGNSDAAHACQKGGWAGLQGTDGTVFANQDACVSYAALGGTLIARALPSITVNVAPAVDVFGGPGFTISGIGTNFTANVWVHFQVQFYGAGAFWSHTFTSDSEGGVNYNFTPFVASCSRYHGFDLTATDSATGQSVTTIVTTIPCG